MKKNAKTIGYAISIGMLFILTANIVMAQNYFAGTGAGNGNTGTGVTGVGYRALYSSNSGYWNTALGCSSLLKNKTGGHNVSLGNQAMFYNDNGSLNTAVGTQSMYNNTSGTGNTAVGEMSLLANTIGEWNVAVGAYAAFQNQSGNYNTALGNYSLNENVSGSLNVAVGSNALQYSYNGIANTAVGASSMNKTNAGDYNTSVGSYSLNLNTSGNSNTAIGNNAMYASTTGSYNVAVGTLAGNSYSSYTRCTFLGNSTDASVSGLSNATAVGNAATVDASNKVVIGNTAVTSIGGWANWTNLSDRRLKSNINKSELGLGFILSLNPVTYYYTAEGQKNILQTGLIAQEVDEAAKKQGVDFSAVDKSGEYWGLRYATLTVPLIKAIQEMEDNHMAEKEMLNNRIEKLEAAIASLQQKQFPETKSVSLQSILFQNQPNPFNQSTVIRYSLKAGDEKAAIFIRDLNGKLIRQFAVASSANSYITVSGNELAPGTYTYTLIINGMAADTKLMVIAK